MTTTIDNAPHPQLRAAVSQKNAASQTALVTQQNQAIVTTLKTSKEGIKIQQTANKIGQKLNISHQGYDFQALVMLVFILTLDRKQNKLATLNKQQEAINKLTNENSALQKAISNGTSTTISKQYYDHFIKDADPDIKKLFTENSNGTWTFNAPKGAHSAIKAEPAQYGPLETNQANINFKKDLQKKLNLINQAGAEGYHIVGAERHWDSFYGVKATEVKDPNTGKYEQASHYSKYLYDADGSYNSEHDYKINEKALNKAYPDQTRKLLKPAVKAQAAVSGKISKLSPDQKNAMNKFIGATAQQLTTDNTIKTRVQQSEQNIMTLDTLFNKVWSGLGAMGKTNVNYIR